MNNYMSFHGRASETKTRPSCRLFDRTRPFFSVCIFPSVTFKSPGGWNLIGLCPSPMFDPSHKPSTLINVGDKVSFKGIDRYEFIQRGGLVESISSIEQ